MFNAVGSVFRGQVKTRASNTQKLSPASLIPVLMINYYFPSTLCLLLNFHISLGNYWPITLILCIVAPPHLLQRYRPIEIYTVFATIPRVTFIISEQALQSISVIHFYLLESISLFDIPCALWSLTCDNLKLIWFLVLNLH
jgi:hypothetical protein